MSNRHTTKKKSVNKSPNKKTFNSDKIISKIQNLRNSYIQYDSKNGQLMPVDYDNNSKIPFNRIIFMIKHSENLEERTQNSHYVFPYLFDTYLNDIQFLIDNIYKIALDRRLSEKIIYQFDTLYIKVIIECIREYIKNPKYKTENTIHFWNTIQLLCDHINVKESIIKLLKMNKDSLLKNPEFNTLCKITSTEAYYEGLPVDVIPTVLSPELPGNLTIVQASSIYPSMRESVDNEDTEDTEAPISWNPTVYQRLHKIHRSRSRGGKRKTKKSTKRK